MGKLEGKVAVITGGNSGIGLATAKQFVAEGAFVYITGRRQEELDKAAREIGQNVTVIRGDISKLEDIDKIYAAVKEGHGTFDILFANAGIAAFATLGEITEEHFDKIYDINVKGTLFTVQKAIPLLNPGGSIIINGSTTSIMGNGAFSVYGSTKAALRSLVRSWTLDLRGKDLRINLLSPGATVTPGMNGLIESEEERKLFTEGLISQIPLGRFADPAETAKTVVFLASSDSSYVNGVELFVDGGLAQV